MLHVLGIKPAGRASRRHRKRRSPVEIPSLALRDMLPKLPWLALCGLVAVCAIGLELDREARVSPAVYRMVPAPFRAFADATHAATLIESRDAAAAEATTRQLLLRMPVPAENLSLFARAALLGQRNQQAQDALYLAAARGWRDPFVQVVMARTALLSGEPQVAADRVIALIAAGSGKDGFDAALLAEALAVPAVRDAVGRRLAELPELPERFTNVGATVLTPPIYAETMAAMFRAGGRTSCESIARNSRALLAAGDVASARTLWTGTCGPNDARALAQVDFGSDEMVAVPPPFAWEYMSHPDVVRQLHPANGRLVMEYRSRNPGTLPLAVRFTGFAPGVHAIGAAPGFSGHGAVLRVLCLGPKGGGAFVRADLSYGPAVFTVGPDCPVQRLELAAASSGAGKGLALQAR